MSQLLHRKSKKKVKSCHVREISSSANNMEQEFINKAIKDS